MNFSELQLFNYRKRRMQLGPNPALNRTRRYGASCSATSVAARRLA
jgi:hypothetical protein